jgi:hypothetical protein
LLIATKSPGCWNAIANIGGMVAGVNLKISNS